MSHAERTIGAAIHALRLQRGMSPTVLATGANLAEPRLARIEQGLESFTVAEAERIGTTMQVPFRALVSAAYAALEAATAPRVDPQYLRRQVPLPGPLTHDELAAALDDCQTVIHLMNRNMRAEIGKGLQDLIQGNNFSGLVSNVLSNSMDKCTPFKHNHHQKYPDLLAQHNGQEVGLEIKTTLQLTKGGESHNGHSGWHMIAVYKFNDDGDILFVNAMLADLVAANLPNPDWKYVGSKVDEDTGSQRTETYNTTGHGTTKLRDGSAYFDKRHLNYARWQQKRYEGVPMPTWSLFAEVAERPAVVPRKRRAVAAAAAQAVEGTQLF